MSVQPNIHVSINFDSSRETSNKAGDTRYPDSEPDNVQRDGEVYAVRRGVGNKSDSETVLHHWAIAIKFDDGKWIVIEGVNEDGMLLPGYSNSSDYPDGTVIDIDDSPASGLDDDQKLQYILVFTQMLKAISFEIVRYVRASPKDLHSLAGSIPAKPYCPGTCDCQTWFLDALRKLQFFEIGDKKLGDCAFDTLRAPVKTLTNTTFKAASTVTSTGLEAANTVARVFSLEENPATALLDGAGKTTNHVISGVSDTASAAVDGVAGFAVNAVGLLTGGGCATKNGLFSDFESLQREVEAGNMNAAEATVKTFGKAAGNLVYGVANTTTNVVGGVAETATGLVSGVAGTVAAPFKAVDDVARKVASGEMNPIVGVAAAPVMAVAGVVEGVGTTILDVGAGVGNTVVGIFKGIGSIF